MSRQKFAPWLEPEHEIAHARELAAQLEDAMAREHHYGKAALAEGISPERREHLRNLQLSARAEVKLRDKALAHRLPAYRLARHRAQTER